MRELITLEVDKYEPIPDKPGMVRHVGMVSPQEAFDALEKHLKEADLLPDEYFNPSTWAWKGLKELPDYRCADCFVNWGTNEGIYLEIDLLYRDEKQQLQTLHFATGKTLGTSGDDFLRMSRISAECSMMLNGRGEMVRFYEEETKEPPKVYCLCEEYEGKDGIREFQILATSTDREQLRELMEAKIASDEYGFIADNGISEHNEYSFCSEFNSGFVQYYVLEEKVLSREELQAEIKQVIESVEPDFEEANPDLTYDSEERTKIWLDELLKNTGKSSLEDLSVSELAEEIEEVNGTISNERLWAYADDIHYGNIEVLSAYRTELEELLDKAKVRESSLDDVIKSCEKMSKNGDTRLGETAKTDREER